MSDNHDKAKTAIQAGFEAIGRDQWKQALPAFAQALNYVQHNPIFALMVGASLWHEGSQIEALNIWSIYSDKNLAIRTAQFNSEFNPVIRKASKLADYELRRHFTQLQSDVIQRIGSQTCGRVSDALWPQTHFGAVDYPPKGPRPYIFFVPDLPPIPIVDRHLCDWTTGLEAATDIIRKEYMALIENNIQGRPYIEAHAQSSSEWDRLRGQDRWTSFHIFKNGQPTEMTELCPQTVAALQKVPLVYHTDHPMEVFFSALKPDSHIPPHYGLANCRLTVHLPLIIPENCAIRVQEHVHEWSLGETFLFDDSFNHEAWNKSDQMRVVLIFEAWRPDLTGGEIHAIEQSYAARQTWLESRKLPDLAALL